MTGAAHPAVDLLDELLANRIDPLVSRTLVVDRLLDLRNSLADDRLLVAVVDQRLVDVPGETTTSGGWWRQELMVLRDLVVEGLAAPEAAR